MAERDGIQVSGLPPGIVPAAPVVGEVPLQAHGEASDWEVPQARSAHTPPHQPSAPPAGTIAPEPPPPEPEPQVSLEGPDTVVYVVIEAEYGGGSPVEPLRIPFGHRFLGDRGDPQALAEIATAVLQTIALQENPPPPPDIIRPCYVTLDEDASRIVASPRTYQEGAMMWTVEIPAHPVVQMMARECLPIVERAINDGSRADDELEKVKALLLAAAERLPASV